MSNPRRMKLEPSERLHIHGLGLQPLLPGHLRSHRTVYLPHKSAVGGMRTVEDSIFNLRRLVTLLMD